MITKPKDTAELVKALRKLKTDPNLDIEDVHVEADRLLVEFIDDPEVTKAFEDIDKWYA
jgi:hypothetical protein